MPLLSIKLHVDADDVDLLSDALLGTGALAVSAEDADAGTLRERALFEGESESGIWKHTVINALFPEGSAAAECVSNALDAAGLAADTKFEVEAVADQDWVQATQAQFEPVRVSPRLWVVPTWHVAPDPDAINLIIDPGLAFGTGTHPSTRLCLAWLDVYMKGGETVLDYGCGSGILAIAAMKLGAGRAVGIDIDPAALLTARNNALQNEVAAEFVDAEAPVPEDYDIVVANILANPLKMLAPLLARCTRARGKVVLSGILQDQAFDVNAAYREWFDIRVTAQEDEWVLLAGVKR